MTIVYFDYRPTTKVERWAICRYPDGVQLGMIRHLIGGRLFIGRLDGVEFRYSNLDSAQRRAIGIADTRRAS